MVRRPTLFALPVLAAFGSLVPGVGSLFAFRLAVIALGLLAVLNPKQSLSGLATARSFKVTAVAWSLTALLGMFFVTDFDAGSREALSVVTGFVLVYALIHARDSIAALESLRLGWAASYVLTGMVAAWEIVTGRHLGNYYFPDALLGGGTPYIASVFGNPNAYAAFLVSAFAFLALGTVAAKSQLERYLYVAMTLGVPVLVFQTGSRLCLVALALEIAFIAVLLGRRYRRALALGTVVTAAAILLAGAGVVDQFFERLPGGGGVVAPSVLVREVLEGGADTSGGIRLALFQNGIWMLGESGGLGVGPGAYEARVSSGMVPYDTGGIVNPHNGYIEILAQYGFIVFVLFIVWIGTLTRHMWRRVRRGEGLERTWAVVIVGALLANGLSALASSTYLAPSVNWMFLATAALAGVASERGATTLADEPSSKTTTDASSGPRQFSPVQPRRGHA